YGEAPDGSSSGVVFRSLADEIFDAFRYKTRFRTRAGRRPAWAACGEPSDSFPHARGPKHRVRSGDLRGRFGALLLRPGRDRADPAARGLRRAHLHPVPRPPFERGAVHSAGLPLVELLLPRGASARVGGTGRSRWLREAQRRAAHHARRRVVHGGLLLSFRPGRTATRRLSG